MRRWTELVAAWGDLVPLPLTVLGLLLLAALAAVLWFTWPAWSPSRWRLPRWRRRGPKRPRQRRRFRFRRPRWRLPRWRRRRRADSPETVTAAQLARVENSDEELPDVSPQVFSSLADRLAAEGRYAEAVRERLRGIVRELVDHQVVPHHPGWTVTELARSAGRGQPQVEPPLTGATDVFSEIWYGQRPADAGHDQLMRGYADQVHRTVAGEGR